MSDSEIKSYWDLLFDEELEKLGEEKKYYINNNMPDQVQRVSAAIAARQTPGNRNKTKANLLSHFNKASPNKISPTAIQLIEAYIGALNLFGLPCNHGSYTEFNDELKSAGVCDESTLDHYILNQVVAARHPDTTTATPLSPHEAYAFIKQHNATGEDARNKAFEAMLRRQYPRDKHPPTDTVEYTTLYPENETQHPEPQHKPHDDESVAYVQLDLPENDSGINLIARTWHAASKTVDTDGKPRQRKAIRYTDGTSAWRNARHKAEYNAPNLGQTPSVDTAVNEKKMARLPTELVKIDPLVNVRKSVLKPLEDYFSTKKEKPTSKTGSAKRTLFSQAQQAILKATNEDEIRSALAVLKSQAKNEGLENNAKKDLTQPNKNPLKKESSFGKALGEMEKAANSAGIDITQTNDVHAKPLTPTTSPPTRR